MLPARSAADSSRNVQAAYSPPPRAVRPLRGKIDPKMGPRSVRQTKPTGGPARANATTPPHAGGGLARVRAYPHEGRVGGSLSGKGSRGAFEHLANRGRAR